MKHFALEDLLHPWRSLYRTSPWVKRTAGWAYSRLPLSLRYGPELRRATELLKQSQRWSPAEMLEYQWGQVRALLNHAYTHVPYYRRVWKEAGICPSDINGLTDLRHLPLLTKELVRAHRDELVADNYRDRLLLANTGGSTGQPLAIYWERGRTRSLERAFMWRQWHWAGFSYGEQTAILRGQTVCDGSQYDPIDNHLFISSFDLGDDALQRCVEQLRRFRPVSLQAYPSTATVLARYMQRVGASPIEGLRVLLCGSENLSCSTPATRGGLQVPSVQLVWSRGVCVLGGRLRAQ